MVSTIKLEIKPLIFECLTSATISCYCWRSTPKMARVFSLCVTCKWLAHDCRSISKFDSYAYLSQMV